MAGKRVRDALSARKVETVKKPGHYHDGGGLSLIVEPTRTRRWLFRTSIKGKQRATSLGHYPTVSLAEAREKRDEILKAAREGRDAVAETRATRQRAITFADEFAAYFEDKRNQLSNGKHAAQWVSTMERYVLPVIGARPIAEVTPAEVVNILRPIWRCKPETASRVLQRMTCVFDAALVLEHRLRANPCAGVTRVLGDLRKDVKHHRALPYGELPALVAQLRRELPGRACGTTPSRLALEWAILTAARSGETRGAKWDEIETEAKHWTISARRMKAGIEHIVPLPDRCISLLALARKLAPDSPFIFPGPRGLPLSDMTLTKLLRELGVADRATVHGFRSGFRDWATEAAKAREVVAEAALAHSVRNKVEAAYRRATYLDERRDLMNGWATFLAEPSISVSRSAA